MAHLGFDSRRHARSQGDKGSRNVTHKLQVIATNSRHLKTPATRLACRSLSPQFGPIFEMWLIKPGRCYPRVSSMDLIESLIVSALIVSADIVSADIVEGEAVFTIDDRTTERQSIQWDQFIGLAVDRSRLLLCGGETCSRRAQRYIAVFPSCNRLRHDCAAVVDSDH